MSAYNQGMNRPIESESTVDASHSVTVPTSVRAAAGIEVDDKLRWRVDDDGNLRVEHVPQRAGSFATLEPIELEEETNAGEDPFA